MRAIPQQEYIKIAGKPYITFSLFDSYHSNPIDKKNFHDWLYGLDTIIQDGVVYIHGHDYQTWHNYYYNRNRAIRNKISRKKDDTYSFFEAIKK